MDRTQRLSEIVSRIDGEPCEVKPFRSDDGVVSGCRIEYADGGVGLNFFSEKALAQDYLRSLKNCSGGLPPEERTEYIAALESWLGECECIDCSINGEPTH